MSSALIRIISCDYSPMSDRLNMHVEVIHPEDSDLDRAYIVVAPVKSVRDENELKQYIEDDITSQRQAVPNWSGVSWKSTRV